MIKEEKQKFDRMIREKIVNQYSDAVEGRFISCFGVDGWDEAAIVYPEGSYFIRDQRNVLVKYPLLEAGDTYEWFLHSGYLPCPTTKFEKEGLLYQIMHFADLQLIHDREYALAYTRIQVQNLGSCPVHLEIQYPEIVTVLQYPSNEIQVEQILDFDFVAVLKRKEKDDPLPSSKDLVNAGSFLQHFCHMKDYWEQKLRQVMTFHIPKKEFTDCYRAGIIYTQIAKHGTDLRVGVNGYCRVFDHDSIGIIVSLISIGYIKEAVPLLENLAFSNQYADATWKYSWPWALYYLKTKDIDLIKKYWNRIKLSAKKTAEDISKSEGLMKKTNDIDADGFWTLDNWSAMTGLAAFLYLASAIEDWESESWIRKIYKNLYLAWEKQFRAVQKKHQLDYIPASVFEPNTENRTRVPNDANWATHLLFGRWAWDGWLLNCHQSDDFENLIDQTYDYGFERLKQADFPKGTFGGYPFERCGGYCTCYNTGLAIAGLRGKKYRTLGFECLEFMIDQAMSGPYAWWENIDFPDKDDWKGIHPKKGHGSCPHSWGLSTILKYISDSLAVEKYDGTLILGRGIPSEWLYEGVVVEKIPVSSNSRLGYSIKEFTDHGIKYISVCLNGDYQERKIVLSLPIFINDEKNWFGLDYDYYHEGFVLPSLSKKFILKYESKIRC